MQRTRRQILDILKRRGRATLEELSREVGLSPVTVRVHLSVLQRDDLVSVEEVRGRVGRPYFVYSLTEEAEELFPKRYHVLASRILSSVNDTLAPEQVQELLRHMAEVWAGERAPRLDGKDLAEKVAEVARIRTEEGAIADWEKTDDGYVIKQYNCPNLLVSRVHSQVCDVEKDYISRLLSTPVTRVDCRAEGNRFCSYLIPQPGAG